MTETPNAGKTLIIGLDGATFDIIEPLVEAGRMPVMARLFEEGTRGRLRTTVPPVTASAWTSFMTGMNPGKHGLYDFVYFKDGTYDTGVVDSRMRSGLPLWSILARHGLKSGVLNVPACYPPDHVDPFCVSGIMTPGPESPYFHPPELREELDRAIGGYILHEKESYAKGKVDSFLADLHRTADRRLEAALYLMVEKPWDLFTVVFTATDRIQHELWRCHDPSHPLHDPEEGRRYGEAINELYVRIDGYLGRLIGAAPPGTRVVLMSDHGAGPLRYFFYVNNWLRREGCLAIKNNLDSRVRRALFDRGFTPKNVFQALTRVAGNRLKSQVNYGRAFTLLRRFFLSFNNVDWSKTTAFSLGNIGQIYINVEGKWPEGCVKEKDYEAVREELIAKLLAEKNPGDGGPLTTEVYRREELYHGPRADRAPDIVFLPRGIETIAFGEYEFGSREIVAPSFGITGHHRMEGIFLIRGEGVRQGETIEGATILDVAPTLLWAMGLPVLSEMDGRVLFECFEEEYADARPLEFVEMEGEAGRADAVYSDEEAARVGKRLKDLGYL